MFSFGLGLEEDVIQFFSAARTRQRKEIESPAAKSTDASATPCGGLVVATVITRVVEENERWRTEREANVGEESWLGGSCGAIR